MELFRRIAAALRKPAQEPASFRPPAARRPSPPAVTAPAETEEDDYRRAAYN